MAKTHKFLPFVTETTSPEATFKALVQRSKNLNSMEISAIFGAILEKGIKKVRKDVSQFSENVSANEVYSLLANKYQPYKLSLSEIDYWLEVVKANREIINQEDLPQIFKNDFKNTHIAVFTACCLTYGDSDSKDIGLIPASTKPQMPSTTYLQSLSTVKFHEDGIKIGFKNLEQLQVFITLLEYKFSDDVGTVIRINPCYIASDKNEKEEYETWNAKKPYDFIKEFTDETS